MTSLMNQETRFLRWLGDRAQNWILLSLRGEEKLSQPYCWEATFRIEEGTQTPLTGQKLAFEIGIAERRRLVHGVLTRVEQKNGHDGVQTFIGRIEPAFVLAKAVRKLRVFQNLSVPDLVISLLKEHEISDVKLSLSGSYPEKEYLIQYRESDFSFINRLLEAAGITYFFVHHKDKHELILADHAKAWPGARLPTLPYLPVTGKRENYGVADWSSSASVEGEKVDVEPIYYEAIPQSSAKNENKTANDESGGVDDESLRMELCQQKGHCSKPEVCRETRCCQLEFIIPCQQIRRCPQPELCRQANRCQLQQQASAEDSEEVICAAQLRYEGMSCGESFTLEKHPSADGLYAVSALSFTGNSNQESAADYHCHVDVFPAEQSFKPVLSTPVPHIGGVLTATVVGPDSEEIHTDELGRIKIQFPWDEKHPYDDSSSCWMRVSQPWSAGNFGALFLPRVGSEVLVSFVQGHPDHPIITGAVYSDRHKPPLTLPGDKNLSGLVSRSSPDGEINEGHRLVFDDKKQQEKLIIESQKDLLLTVKNDAEITIAANRTCEITEGNDLLTLKQGDSQLVLEKGDSLVTLNNGEHKTTISGGGSLLKADKACVIESMEAITLKVGSSEITLKPDGITLKAAKVTLKADTSVAIDGAQVEMKGSASVAVEGAKVDVKGSAMVTIDGGLIKLG